MSPDPPRPVVPVPMAAPIATCLAALLFLPACAEPDLVVYVSLDQVFSQELIAEFERETGLSVRAEYDTEANKTVVLVQRIIAEADHTRCDVFWNNEFAWTVHLAQQGLLQSYDSPSAADIPELFRDPERRCCGPLHPAERRLRRQGEADVPGHGQGSGVEDALAARRLGAAPHRRHG